MKKLLVLVIVVALGYLLYAVWPTPYSTETTKDGIFRTNRITGSRDQWNDDQGWIPLDKTLDLSDRNNPIGVKPASESTGSEPKL